ncbi:MAG: hypothetical protein JRI57_10410 [Deltaproteobacteria bacterium]|nr:hypothetical protein [Deltaproteobacteria bacterium]MBW1953613.1 hypothetical protein [Deltaproteobacteria bacterium]MBW1987620.1 hypothetical protein [Deltaproteobacteria bacterium]MBW2135676.1 hypothetical protein [Deltaproteobacteria bacterium]
MEDNVRKELEVIKTMVLNWKRSYLGFATPEGGDEYLAEEFAAEISEHISPFVMRMYACKYLTPDEVNDFLDVCYNEVEDLRQTLETIAAPPQKKGLLVKFVEHTKSVWRK